MVDSSVRLIIVIPEAYQINANVKSAFFDEGDDHYKTFGVPLSHSGLEPVQFYAINIVISKIKLGKLQDLFKKHFPYNFIFEGLDYSFKQVLSKMSLKRIKGKDPEYTKNPKQKHMKKQKEKKNKNKK